MKTGNLYYFIDQAVKNNKLQSYDISQDKGYYYNMLKQQDIYNNYYYISQNYDNFKIYTYNLPFHIKDKTTNYEFYFIQLENPTEKIGLIYLQNHPTLINKNQYEYDIRCQYLNKCKTTPICNNIETNKNQIIQLINSIKNYVNDKITFINKLLSLIDYTDNYLITSMPEADKVKLFNNLLIKNIRLNINVEGIDYDFIYFINDLYNYDETKMLLNYCNKPIFGIHDPTNIFKTRYCIQLYDTITSNGSYDTYIGIIHNNEICDLKTYEDCTITDFMFTLIYKVLNYLEYKGPIYIHDASSYVINATKKIIIPTALYMIIKKDYTIYEKYGFKNDYSIIDNEDFIEELIELYLTTIETNNLDKNKYYILEKNGNIINLFDKELDEITILFYDDNPNIINLELLYEAFCNLIKELYVIYRNNYIKTKGFINDEKITDTNADYWNDFYNNDDINFIYNVFFKKILTKQKTETYIEFNKCKEKVKIDGSGLNNKYLMYCKKYNL